MDGCSITKSLLRMSTRNGFVLYLDARKRGQLRDPKAPPLSMRMLSGVHGRLMAGVRGADKLPGQVRRSQNWVGGSRPSLAAHAPPPPHRLPELLGAGVLVETTGRQRDRSFAYECYLDRLKVGTELGLRRGGPRSL